MEQYPERVKGYLAGLYALERRAYACAATTSDHRPYPCRTSSLPTCRGSPALPA